MRTLIKNRTYIREKSFHGVVPDPKCQSGKQPEILDHILWSYELYNKHRKELYADFTQKKYSFPY